MPLDSGLATLNGFGWGITTAITGGSGTGGIVFIEDSE